MKKAVVFAFMAIAVMLGIYGCTKEGPVGPQGPAGTNGTNGTNGNANVIGTVTATVTSWSSSSTLYYANFTCPGLSQDIVDKGAVMAYEQFGTSWVALPITNTNISKYYYFTLQQVTVAWRNTDGSQTANPGTQTYRFVFISSSRIQSHPEVDYRNYEQVKEVFNLRD